MVEKATRGKVVIALEFIALVFYLIFGGYTELKEGNVYAFLATLCLVIAIICSSYWLKVKS